MKWNPKNRLRREHFRALLNDPPESWPEVWLRLRYAGPVRISADVDQRVQGQLQRLVRRRRLQTLGWLAAAALVVAGFGAAFLWFGAAGEPIRKTPRLTAMSVYRQRVTLGGFNAGLRLVRNELVRRAERGLAVQRGDILSLNAGGIVYLRAGPDTTLRLDGPALVEVAEHGYVAALSLRVFVEYGDISIRSHGAAKPLVVWETAGYSYMLQGTVASLSVGRDSQRLLVLEGAFEVRETATAAWVQVTEKQGLLLETLPSGKGGLLQPKRFSQSDLNWLQRLDELLNGEKMGSGGVGMGMPPIRNKKPVRRPVSNKPHPPTAADILKKGLKQTVTLRNGEKLEGSVLGQGSVYFININGRVREVKGSEIKNIE